MYHFPPWMFERRIGMNIGFIGLGKMGGNMVKRLLKGGHDVVVYARTRETRERYAQEGAVAASSLENLVDRLTSPKVVWSMVPAGDATERTIRQLSELLSPGDLIVDGGNSWYKDSIKRSRILGARGINFVDAGTSGGVWGLEKGYCIMAGGEGKDFKRIEPLLCSLCPKDGYLLAGPSGSGHFVKMVHNGIEYGMLQAYGEGFALLRNKDEFDLDLGAISKLWNNSSVIRSWLLELCEDLFSENPELSDIDAYVEDSGEGRWTVLESVEEGVDTPVITLSLFKRYASRNSDSFSDRTIAGLRKLFGGHSTRGK